MTAEALYGIGLTAAGITSLPLLGVELPKAEAVDYAEYVLNGAGSLVGQGWLRCAWRFACLTAAQVATLEQYAGACYIRTLKADGTYAAYSANMVIQPRKAPKVGSIQDYYVEFNTLVAV